MLKVNSAKYLRTEGVITKACLKKCFIKQNRVLKNRCCSIPKQNFLRGSYLFDFGTTQRKQHKFQAPCLSPVTSDVWIPIDAPFVGLAGVFMLEKLLYLFIEYNWNLNMYEDFEFIILSIAVEHIARASVEKTYALSTKYMHMLKLRCHWGS
jgi:hypothetical protein